MRAVHSLSDMAKRVNRPVECLSGLQQRFKLPVYEGAGYSDAYLLFLRTLVLLGRFGIAEERLLQIWHLEKTLLVLLHVDTAGSPTWFLDSCGLITHREQRLLLSNFDLGVTVPSRSFQMGLNFAQESSDPISRTDMGEDALRVLNDYIPLVSGIRADLVAELPILKEAIQWAGRLKLSPPAPEQINS